MSNKKYCLSHDELGSITFSVDVEKFAQEAPEINGFWSGGEYRLHRAGGCHIKAALTLMAAQAFYWLIEGYATEGVILQICKEEGYPSNLSEMVKIVEEDIPGYGASWWHATELKEPGCPGPVN